MKKILSLLVAVCFLVVGSAIVNTAMAAKKKAKYYKELTLNPDRTIVLFGTIEPRMIQNAINTMIELEQFNDRMPIYVVIDSPGGYVSAGWKFINTLKAIKAPTIGVVASRAYSMAAIIALYFDKLYMVDTADIMFHEAAFLVGGSETIAKSRFFATIKYLDKLHKRIAQKLGMPFDSYKDLIQGEWWMLPEGASEAGICDGIIMSLKYKFNLPPSRFFLMTEDADLTGNNLFMGMNPPIPAIEVTLD